MTESVALDAGIPSPPPWFRKKSIWLMIGAGVLTGVGFCFYLSTNKQAELVSPLDPQPAQHKVPVDVAADTPPAGTATPVATAETSIAMASAASVDNKTDITAAEADAKGRQSEILSRLTAIDQSNERQDQEIAKLLAQMNDLLSFHANQHAKSAHETAPAKKKALRKTPNKPAQESAPIAQPTPAPVEPAPALLSVDTWNGQPSVVVRQGSKVQFLSEGDRTGTYTLQRADRNGQRAIFADPSGTVTTGDRVER